MKIIAVFLMIITLFSSCVNPPNEEVINFADPKSMPEGEYPGALDEVFFSTNELKSASRKIINYDKMVGIWVSYGDLRLSDINSEQCAEYFNEMMKGISDFGFNTVFFHVRPFGDSLYSSKLFPTSHLITGKQGDKITYDPLKLAIEAAHKYKLSFQAWINPMRILLKNGDSSIPYELSKDNPAYEWLNDEDLSNDKNVMQYEGSLYYNIGEEQTVELITDGIKEIAENYNVDGIHFDDYFYPSTDETLDNDSYSEYMQNGGEKSLTDYRIDNVNRLIKKSYDAVKSVDSRLLFGVSPSANVQNNLQTIGADAEYWAKTDGYVDYLIPQIYYGFENETMPFENVLESWKNIVEGTNVSLIIGIAGYKTGEEDGYALSGKFEWTENDDILSRQTEIILKDKSCSGVCVFDYDAIFHSNASDVRLSEREGLRNVLNDMT